MLPRMGTGGGGRMLGLKFDEAKDIFFDRQRLIRAVDRATMKVLSQFGAFVRTDAKRSMRKAKMQPLASMSEEERKKHRMIQRIRKQEGKPKPRRRLQPSAPGEPPRVVMGLLRSGIFFGFDPQSRSVVIGPALINKPQSSGFAPQKLEEGGISRTASGKTVRIRPRPYMGPAFQRNKAKIPQLYRDAVKP